MISLESNPGTIYNVVQWKAISIVRTIHSTSCLPRYAPLLLRSLTHPSLTPLPSFSPLTPPSCHPPCLLLIRPLLPPPSLRSKPKAPQAPATQPKPAAPAQAAATPAKPVEPVKPVKKAPVVSQKKAPVVVEEEEEVHEDEHWDEEFYSDQSDEEGWEDWDEGEYYSDSEYPEDEWHHDFDEDFMP